MMVYLLGTISMIKASLENNHIDVQNTVRYNMSTEYCT